MFLVALSDKNIGRLVAEEQVASRLDDLLDCVKDYIRDIYDMEFPDSQGLVTDDQGRQVMYSEDFEEGWVELIMAVGVPTARLVAMADEIRPERR